MKGWLGMVLMSLALAASALAAVPQGVQYQGTLAHPDGTPMDTTVAMVFGLFADSTGGTAVWSESHSAVTVAHGLFSIRLGWITEFPDNALQLPQLWMGVTVGNNSEMQPRVRVVSTFFALRAGEVDSIKGGNVSQLLQLLASLPDADGDGHIKMSMGGDDCDDLDPTVYAGAAEICDGKDNDCDRVVDEGLGVAYFRDADSDGYGISTNQIFSCNPPASGWSLVAGDCDDNDPTRNPGVTEVCDGVDNNCNGLVDDGFQTTWYVDADGDTWGSLWDSVTTCIQPPGYVALSGDCNDTDPAIHPGVPEICNGIDDDCNGLIDEYVQIAWYMDNDGDGYGYYDVIIWACTQPDGFVANYGDCNDLDPLIHPGAPEICNGIDDNCDGVTDEGATCPTGYICSGGTCVQIP